MKEMKMTSKYSVITLNKKDISDFAKERNLLLKKANKKWVLFLDKDEKIDNFQFQVSDNFSSYKLIRKNFFLGKYVGTDRITRLVQKGTGQWKRKVHEIWENDKRHAGGVLPSIIIHNTADNLRTYVSKLNKYSGLHAEENYKEGKKSNLIKIIFYPFVKFWLTFFQSKDVVFSIMQSFHSFLAWSKEWEKYA